MQSAKIVEWFLGHEAETSGSSTITNMKAQKLVYLAESAYGSLYGERLLDEPIQAWDHGPVVKLLYGALKHNGKRPIPAPPATTRLSEDVTEVLETIWDIFGSMTPAQLRSLTHDLGPYENHHRAGVRDITLPPEEVHQAWPEFLDSGTTRSRRIDPGALADLRCLRDEGRATASADEDVDTGQLMSDFHAFAALA